MKAEKILFPTDFSHTGDAALEMATALARDSGALLLIAHVQEPAEAYGGGAFYGIQEPLTEQLRKMLHEVRPTDPAVVFEHRLIAGDPGAALARLADEENVDLIVMATHGRTGFRRILMGSVAEAVVRRANCPVLTWKQAVAETVPPAK
jgi:universal stress protein A